jgi:branched-chain amino acid transport system permease protein
MFLDAEEFADSIRAFVIILLRGLGSVPGMLAFAVLLGLVETLGSYAVGARPATIIPFAVILVVLFWRPTGLLGARHRIG